MGYRYYGGFLQPQRTKLHDFWGEKTDMEIITLNELQARADPLHRQSRCFKDT